MTNPEIARIFDEIGEILEYQNENPFRVRSYHQAARTLEFYPQPLERVYKVGGREALLAIPGLGEALVDKVVELVETGELFFYKKLREKIPAIVLQLATIPGVGPKTAKKLYETLKPKSVEELHAKLTKLNRLAKKMGEAKGFHEKTISNILRGIDIQASLGNRLVLSDAFPVAEYFIEELKKKHKLDRIDMAGSLRRMRETVGDIDLIAATNQPKKVINTFVALPGVTRVLAKGDTKAMVLYNNMAHVDLEILPVAEYGSLLQHFTGSKEHNIAFRSAVDDHGLSFSEHGFKVTKPDHPLAACAITAAKKDGRWDAKRAMIVCDREEQVYETAGYAWIPPELRENTGELSAAQSRTLPKLLELSDMRGDLHVHSHKSGDGREEPERIIERAIELGYAYIGITDHTQGLGVAGRLTNKELANHAQALRKINQKYPEIRVLPGCELNIMADGTLDVPDDILEELDVVVASIHTAMAQPKDVMTARIIRALENPHVDVLAHPTTRILNYRGEIQVDWEAVYAKAAETQTALEINAYPERLDLDGVRIRRAKELGCKFVISTDSHQLRHLDNMRFGVAMARRGWATKDEILNALPADKFMKWLQRGQPN